MVTIHVSNMQEARFALWEENIISLFDKCLDAFSNWFSYWFDKKLHVHFDRDSNSALTKKNKKTCGHKLQMLIL